MTGRRFTRSVLKDDTSTTAADTNVNSNDDTMEVDKDNNNHQPANNNRRTSPRRRSSQTSETTNPILDDMSDIELDLSDTATTTVNNVRTVSEEQVTASDDDDIDMEIGKLDDEQQWPSPPSNNATNPSSSNNDASPTMETYQQQYYGGGKSADNDKLKSYRISHLQHRISTLETQVSSLSSPSSSTNVAPPLPMSSSEEEMLKRRISEMEYELQMRRNRTNRLRRLIMDYVQLPSIVIDDAMPMGGEGVGLNGQQWEIYEQQFGMNVAEGANVVSPLVQQQQMIVNNGQVSGLDSLPELPVMNLNDDDNGDNGQSGKKRGYAEV